MVKNSTKPQSTTYRSRVRPVLGAVVSAAATAVLLTFTPGTAAAQPGPPTMNGSLGSAAIDISGALTTFLEQLGTGSSGSLGSVGVGSVGRSPAGSLGSSSTGSMGSSYGSAISSPFS
ncbi:hypothetical protein ERC79_09465 [Rhodococcus sp. ABRD24]|uniref:hypothetical protein n=1 Tax=Rhodococcus sp. ABRD24 TaxID=2507582 RepID=UPI0010397B57|nr:hypothetical protein [Rhodococcus sp. ABRD24]QBJ96175.1 hypothetical protein ERC79_09465 [Rhodococcus sp. ABRD24]